jgi:uncharacterized Ntn-hydrolase superfamily protein
MARLRTAASLFAYVFACSGAVAHATYSIVAADRATRQVGGAVTSCVPGSVAGVYGSAPGKGAVASQAASNRQGRDEAVRLLIMDVAPQQIITRLTGAAFDPGAAQRQYGVVDLMGRAAGHSGAGNGNFSGDRQGQAGDFTYSIQGNILTGPAVLAQAENAFRGESCDLADRLMRALEAGAANGQGDSRCTRLGAPSPSSSAFIAVDRPGEPAGSYLRISVLPQGRSNPLPRLRAQFDAWRATHPCSSDAPDAGAPPPDTAPPDASLTPRDAAAPDRGGRMDAGATQGGGPRPDAAGGGAGGTSGSGGAGGAAGPIAGAGGGANPGSGGAAMAGSGGGATAGAAGASAPGPGAEGCQCGLGRHSSGSAAGSVVLVLALIIRRRRR